MNGNAVRRVRRSSLLLALAGGVLLGLAHPGTRALDPIAGPALALPGVALAFFALRTSAGPRGAFFAGWIAGGAHFAIALHWMVYPFLVKAESHLWALPFAVVLVPVGFGLFWASAFLAARWIARGKGFALAVAFAAAVAAAEWLRGSILTGFPWAMPGHVWIGTEARILYPAFGTSVATLLTLLAPALAAGGIPERAGGMRAGLRFSAGIVLCAGVAAAAYAGARELAWGRSAGIEEPAAGPVLQLVQPNIPQREKWSLEHRSRNLETLLSLSEPMEGRKADFVIWPESAIPVILDRERLQEDGQGLPEVLAQRAGSGATFILGALTESREEGFFNSIVILHGERGLSGIYDKHHLVPFGEYVPLSGLLASLGFDAFAGDAFQRGLGPVLMEPPGVAPFVPVICYEVIFPGEIRRVAGKASWILQVTNDAWFGPDAGPKQHMALAQIRAAEFGVPLVRVANTGITGIVDATGRVLESLPMNEAGALVRALPENPYGITPFAFWGDLVFHVLLVVSLVPFAAVLAFARLRRRWRQDR